MKQPKLRRLAEPANSRVRAGPLGSKAVSISQAEIAKAKKYQSEIRDGMRVDWDVPIKMDDGLILRADVYRPIEDGQYPVLMTYGPYAKGLSFQEGYSKQWEALVRDHPDVSRGTSCKYANWETADPERWVPEGYICIRVDSRGSGRSPGKVDPFSERETLDYFHCIEWAAEQPWSNGKVGLLGVSYYAMNQWQVAALHPKGLAAIVPFEGASDWYRDGTRHGGILSTFFITWYPIQVMSVQNGLGDRGRRNPNTGEPIAGPGTLPDEVLAGNRVDMREKLNAQTRIDNAYYDERRANLSAITTPLLSCGNWGGAGLHLRGNVEGYLQAGSSQKWLELHGLEHWTEFYTDYGFNLQKRFLDHFLKGADNGWDRQPPVKLQVRKIDGFVERDEQEWPLARTKWTPVYLDVERKELTRDEKALGSEQTAQFSALDETVTLMSQPFPTETEITGPVALKLFVSSSTVDADIFATVRLFRPDGSEVLFVGAVDPNAPVAQGWLRASHRKLDPERSEPYRPYHTHDERQPLLPGEVYELDIEIWPTSVVVPAGYRIGLTIGGTDFDHGLPEPMPQLYGRSQRGSSVFTHDDELDRPTAVFGGVTKLHSDAHRRPRLLLPIIPE